MFVPSVQPTVGFRTALARWMNQSTILAPPISWLTEIQRFGEALGGSQTLVERFTHTWRKLYSATLLLDHVQDRDELDDVWLAAQPEAVQYQLAFSAYALAHHELAELAAAMPPLQGVGLHELWSASVLQLAIGQYRDLTLQVTTINDAEQALDTYEEIAGQKTGAALALALGGVAHVASDDIAHIEAATQAGLLLGVLLQYQDDLLDNVQQQAQLETLTLARAWAAQLGVRADELPLSTLWHLLYAQYRQSLHAVLAVLPDTAQAVIWSLVEAMFGSVLSSSTLTRADGYASAASA